MAEARGCAQGEGRTSGLRAAWRRRPAAPVALALVLAGCGGASAAGGDAIVVSGSSTVAPITMAVARDGGFSVDVAAEGTTDGFARFCAGESAINNASVAIPGQGQRVDYVQQCADNGVEFVELPIALDALTVVRNEANTHATDLTLDELRRIWEPDSDISVWSDVRPEWPDTPIGLYGRPDGSGTFEYFTQVVVGEAGTIRDDYEATDDTDELAGWVAEDEDALGFVGVGNYLAADEKYRDRITNVAVDGVLPSREDAQEGSYQPLTRPLFLYVSTAALEEDAVAEFVGYYLREVQGLLPHVYFYALPREAYPLAEQRFEERRTGSMFDGDPYRGTHVLEALRSDG